jgi:cytochrome P450
MATTFPSATEAIDLMDPVMFDDPFPVYEHLRATRPVAPVKWSQGLRGGGFMLTRYDDVMRMHTDKVFSSDAAKHGTMSMPRFAPKTFRLLTESMVFKDDPEHLRLRSLVNRAFTPKLVASMTDDIEDVVATYIGRLEGQTTVDLVEEYAVQIPLAVISRMLGMSDTDGDAFHGWMKKFAESTSNGPIQMLRALPTARKMRLMFERLAEQRRREPDDRLITALVQARDDDDRLDETELQAMILLLLLAGHDTTSNLIGTATVALLENPDQLDRLRNEPDLIDTAVEELLRYTTPVPCGAPRFVLEDIEMSGTIIPAGSVVLGMIISANRDDSMFEDPDVLDLGRTPNKQLAFAFGAHYCLGNQLARLEGRSALSALVQRFDEIELAVPRSELSFKPTPSLRGYRKLPLRLK